MHVYIASGDKEERRLLFLLEKRMNTFWKIKKG
jgi:hypothetical protein